ncbi:MAG: methyl-accepting chemotaxis protein [Firmicutes bacterium HGW-Firmicutes-14]|nr:MAG: methyl-accepting chemotaxis protein [Firmicutes bacterium HGW-Firmicutes-14]
MKISIRMKLIGSFLLFVLLMTVVGLTGLKTGKDLNESLNDMTENWLPKGVLMEEINFTVANHRIWEVANVLAAVTNDSEALAEYKVKTAEERQKFDDQAENLGNMLVTEKGKAQFNDLQAKWQAYLEIADKCVSLIGQGRSLEAFQILRTDSRQVYRDLSTSLEELNKLNSDAAEQVRQKNEDAYNRSRVINVSILAAALIAGIAGGMYLAGSISKGVGSVTAAAVRLAEGDLTVEKLRVKSGDEIGEMAEAVNKMVENLRELIHTVSLTTQEVVSSSEELSATAEQTSASTQQVAKAINEVATGTGNQAKSVNQAVDIVGQLTAAVEQIATGAQHQSSSVNETNQIISQMVSVIQEVASSAQAVSQSAEKTSRAAGAGEEAVVKTVEGMERIKDKVFEAAQKIKELGEQSTQIGEIIQVIDDIAEQTNLLALNAAIEAARAGEHGKGFAVVADEVRKLAERSGKATKEIAELITGIQKGTNQAVAAMEEGTKEVESGAGLAQNAGNALKQIITTVSDTYDQTQGISAAAEQMAASSDRVVQSVDAVAQVTENNTAATEEMSAASGHVTDTVQNIAAVTQENSAAIEEVSASTEQLSATADQISSSAESLARMAQDLQNIVSRFRT